MRSFWRVVKFAFQDLFRNIGLSTMTVFILILMLLSVNVLWSVDVITREAVRLVKEQINISLYFKPETSDDEISSLKKNIEQLTVVSSTELMSREDVLKSFQERHKGSDEILSALDELGSNPFGPTLVVKMREPDNYKIIMSTLDVPEYENMIETKSYEGHEEGMDRIQTITGRIEHFGLGLSILFAIISFLIIFNTYNPFRIKPKN